LFFSRDIQLLHSAGAGNFYILFDLLVYRTDYILKNVLVREPEINKKENGQNQVADNEPDKIAGKITRSAVFVADLKLCDLQYVDHHKNEGNNAVVHYKLCERFAKCADKRKAMPIADVTRNMKGHREPGEHGTHNKKTSEVYVVKVFRVKKKVRNAEVLAEAARHHGKKHKPA